MGNLSKLIEDAVIFHDGKWPNDNYDSIRFGAESALIWKHEFNIAVDRLRGKPDWKDVLSKHPKAHYLAQWPGINGCDLGLWISYETQPDCENGNGYVVDGEDEVFHHSKGVILGDWRNTLEKRPEQKAEPAPAKTWFEAGEPPPIGVMVEAIIEIKYEECEVIAYFEDMAWLSVGGSKQHPVRMIRNCKFRPIKTDKEKFIDTALANFDEISDKFPQAKNEWLKKLFGQMFDAGFKAPDNKKPD